MGSGFILRSRGSRSCDRTKGFSRSNSMSAGGRRSRATGAPRWCFLVGGSDRLALFCKLRRDQLPKNKSFAASCAPRLSQFRSHELTRAHFAMLAVQVLRGFRDGIETRHLLFFPHFLKPYAKRNAVGNVGFDITQKCDAPARPIPWHSCKLIETHTFVEEPPPDPTATGHSPAAVSELEGCGPSIGSQGNIVARSSHRTSL